MKFIVPDSIEPRLGIKALEIRGDTLYSPQQGTAWPKGKRLEANCNIRVIEWGLRDIPAEGWEERFWVPGSLLRPGESTHIGWPSEDPPKGKTWVPHAAEHQLDKCKGPCGIYVVDTPQQCESYLRNNHWSTQGRRILASIALWGQVVIAEKGARGQYAYPIRLVGPQEWEEEIANAAMAYGIEYTVVPAHETTDEEFARVLRNTAA